MPAAEPAFIAKVRQQLKVLRDEQYAYNELRVYVCGIADPWVFGQADEFELIDDDVLVVRVGPTRDHGNAEVPEVVFPLRQLVATELAVSGG